MYHILFHVPLLSFEVKDWDRKKKELLSVLDNNEFLQLKDNSFLTDRHPDKIDYRHNFAQIFVEEFDDFAKTLKLEEIHIKDKWSVKYNQPGQSHAPHNHRSVGYTGLLYVEYDPDVHEPVKFIGPWNSPITDTTELSELNNAREGVLYIWPSYLIHYVDAMKTDKLRMITSWDMDVK